MPFKSQAQRAYLYANEPEIARRWSSEYPVDESRLPVRAKPMKSKASEYAKALRKR